METSVLPLKCDAEFRAVQEHGDTIDSSPRCGPNCVMCLRDGTLAPEGPEHLSRMVQMALATAQLVMNHKSTEQTHGRE